MNLHVPQNKEDPMNRIFLPIEIKVREFHSKLLFALFAAERGFETVLGGQLELIDRMPRLGNGIYIDKSTAITKREWFKKCRQMGNYVAAWDEEGLLYLNDEVYHATRMDPESFGMTDLFFTWGPHHTRTILAKYPDASDRVVPVGNPRMDLLRPEFIGYCDDRVAELRRKHGRMILINTNFASYNYAKGPEAAAKLNDPYPIKSMRALTEGWAQFQKEGFESFAAAAQAIYDAFPDHTVVIRPCPSEASGPWRQLFDGKERGLVSKEGNVIDWIHAAEASMQFNCTTGVEAYLMGSPSVAYRRVRSPDYDTPLSIACSLEAFTVEELLAQLRRIVAAVAGGKPRPRPTSTIAVEDYMTSLDGATSCERILAEIQRRDFSPRPYTLPALPLIKRIWRAWLRVVRRPDPLDIQYYREKFPGFSVEEAREVALAFSRATERFKNVRIVGAGRNIIRVCPI